MDYVGILANVILYTTVGTLIAAIAAYTAYKLRDRRKPARKVSTHVATNGKEFVFLKRYEPDELLDQQADAAPAAAGARADAEKASGASDVSGSAARAAGSNAPSAAASTVTAKT